MKTLPVSKLTKKQTKQLVKYDVTVDGTKYKKVVCNIRYDDHCGNGHNSFAVTGDFYCNQREINRDDPSMCGCCHDELSKVFPEVKELVKWHLVSSDGPMHYISNTTYHARTTSHDGKKVGGPVAFEKYVLLGNSEWPLKFSSKFINWIEDALKLGFIFDVKSVEHEGNKKGGYQFSPKYTVDSFDCARWCDCPFDSLAEAKAFVNTFFKHGCKIVNVPTKYATAVEPNIEAARNCAVWPDATLEQLQDKEQLQARLPDLMQEFKTVIESLGMEY